MRSILFVIACWCFALAAHSQCSSLLNTPEFPIATHPSDGHTQSWGANIFTPAQFGGAATLTGLQVYVDNSFGPTTYANQTIWIRHTAVSSYPNSTYPGTAGFTQVYSGTYSFPMSGLVTLPFNVSSFAYNGTSNIEILFENRSNVYRSNEPWFRRTASYGASVYRSKWNGNFGFGGFPGSGSDGSSVRLTYTLSLTAVGGGGCGAILPVSLRFFGAEPVQDGVLCAWEPSPDAQVSSYQLERSADGNAFEAMGTVSTTTFIDHAPLPGMSFYRLRMRDQDGNESLSGVVEVNADAPRDQTAHLRIDSEGNVSVVLLAASDQPANLELFDLHGRRLHQSTVALHAGWNTLLVGPVAIEAGVLLARVAGAGQDWTGRGLMLR